ncbi:MAG: glycosyltransferase [bacterium]
MKKILIISFYWPPSGKASMHWPVDIAGHLSKNGFQPVILTVNEDTFSGQDDSFSSKIDPAIQVIKSNFWDPFVIYKKILAKNSSESLVASEAISKNKKGFGQKLSLWIRMNLFVPDARIGWYLPGVRKAKKYLRDNKVDLIISNGPPHTSHLIGKKLSRLFNVPLISVFIDPWVDISYYKEQKRNKLVVKFDNMLEKSVMKQSSRLIFVTKTLKEYFDKKYPFTKDKSEVLYWGYNENAFENISRESHSKEVLVHAGNIYDYQNPVYLWNLLMNEININRRLIIRFIGTIGPKVKSSIENNGLIKHCEFCGFLPYNQVIQEMMNASYLLVCAAESRHVPGKLFEYMRTGNPIIAFGDDNKEVKELLEKSNTGMLFNYSESGKEFFNSIEKFVVDIEYVKGFDRNRIAEKLIDIINKL